MKYKVFSIGSMLWSAIMKIILKLGKFDKIFEHLITFVIAKFE